MPASYPPFALADVDFARDCAPNAAFERLLGLILSRPSGEAEDAEFSFDEPLYNAVSGATSHVLHLSSARDWHGLRLVEVRTYQGIESGPTNYALAFADSPERVRAVWNARGWNLPPVGETRVIEEQVIDTGIGVEAEGKLALVTCFHD